MLIEVCCGSVYDGIMAQNNGAHRIELCSSMFLGGITPSIGAVIEARKLLTIPIVAMVRPRSGGFCYTDSEFAVMKHDIQAFIDAGVDGIIFGILHEDGTYDVARNQILCDMGHKAHIDVVTHRAFDVVPDVDKALETVIELGFKRILTTGHNPRIEDGAHTIKRVIELAKGRIEIMSGGLKPHNIIELSQYMGVKQAHVSSFIPHDDLSCQHNVDMHFGGALYPPEMQYDYIDPTFVRAIMKEAIQN